MILLESGLASWRPLASGNPAPLLADRQHPCRHLFLLFGEPVAPVRPKECHEAVGVATGRQWRARALFHREVACARRALDTARLFFVARQRKLPSLLESALLEIVHGGNILPLLLELVDNGLPEGLVRCLNCAELLLNLFHAQHRALAPRC